MQVQLTDFENAAFIVFVVLLTRAILSFKLNLLVPVSKVTVYCLRGDNGFTDADQSDAGEHGEGTEERCSSQRKILLQKECRP